MRALVQRVASAGVEVAGERVAAIEEGLLVLVGVARFDGPEDADWLARKVAELRVFEDATGRMDRSLLDAGGAALCVSQFTLHGSVRKGTRPSFTAAAPGEQAEPLYERFCAALAARGVPVEQGVFGARMRIALVNDGPVTLLLDSPSERVRGAAG